MITVAGFGLALFLAHPAFALVLGTAISVALVPKLPEITKQVGKFLLQGAIVALGLTMNM